MVISPKYAVYSNYWAFKAEKRELDAAAIKCHKGVILDFCVLVDAKCIAS